MIIFLSILLLPLSYAQTAFVFSPQQTVEQRNAFEALGTKWHAPDRSIAQSFQPIRRLLTSDPTTRELLQHVEKELQQHGIARVEDIIEACKTEKNGGADGGVSHDADIEDVRFRHKDITSGWKKDHGEVAKASYSTQVISVPMFDFLLATQRPSICVDPSVTTMEAFNILVHELTHLDRINFFERAQVRITLTNFNDFLDYNMKGRGGECEAFRAEMAAERNVLTSLGVLNPWAEREFVDPDGTLNEADFARALYAAYDEHYANNGRQNILDFARGMYTFRIDYLKQVLPIIRAIPRDDIAEDIEQEIFRLQGLRANLR